MPLNKRYRYTGNDPKQELKNLDWELTNLFNKLLTTGGTPGPQGPAGADGASIVGPTGPAGPARPAGDKSFVIAMAIALG
jgi:hypothetical protein